MSGAARKLGRAARSPWWLRKRKLERLYEIHYWGYELVPGPSGQPVPLLDVDGKPKKKFKFGARYTAPDFESLQLTAKKMIEDNAAEGVAGCTFIDLGYAGTREQTRRDWLNKPS